MQLALKPAVQPRHPKGVARPARFSETRSFHPRNHLWRLGKARHTGGQIAVCATAAGDAPPIRVPLLTFLALVLLALLVILLGCAPGLLTQFL